MSRLQYDQFVDDDEDECCPLCVEEFDLSDRNFRPCPCGYQICQFCYNNIKTTMNGLCPACRRPYDDSTIEFKNITPEEMAKHKQQIAQKAKKNAQMRQKEAQKAEADSLSRKHLAGLRVVQKNLVYVTGLTPTIREDRLLDTLRGPDYFGQYGKIIKIVVSKARENAQHQQSVGVYVTFARKEDAEACITAVDGSQNGDRVLRAQYGTTKYCSAYLRGEQCNNRNCMFLHEPGEDNESFTRQDLSMMNSIQTQQPAQSSTSRSAPPAHPGPPVSAAVTTAVTAAAAAPMSRQQSNEGSSPTQDAPGLPATAGWASKAALERRASRSTIASQSSPMVQNATPAQLSKASTPAPKKEEPPKVEEPAPKPKTRKEEKKEERKKEKAKEKAAQKSKNASPEPKPVKPKATGFEGLLRTICNSDFKFVFSSAALSEEDFKAIVEFPSLLDPNGGAKRRAMREKEQELLKQREAEAEAKAATQSQPAPAAEPEENEATAGGSLQLGGEPEGSHETPGNHQNQHAIAPPGQPGFGGNLFGNSSVAEDFNNLGLPNRALTPAQQQQLLLNNFKSGSQSAALLSTLQGTQNQQNLGANATGHTRHTSRFSFANDNASASANVQPVASQKIMSQQNSMMPKNANQFNQMPQQQALGGHFFTNVQGPPPGLKPTGTPPVGGTNMFAQGHGFATGGLPYGANANRNTNELYQDLLRNRNMDGGARTADSGKLGTFADEEQATLEVDALVNDDENEPIRPLGTPLAGQFFEQPRRATPSIPPGFTAPAIPRGLAGEGSSLSGSRPGSRPMSRTTSSTIVPAVPVVPVTPAKLETPAKTKKGKQPVKAPETVDVTPVPSRSAVPSTPTKPPKGTGAKAQDITEPLSKTSVDAVTKKTEPKEKKPTPETPAKTAAKGKAANKKVEKVEKAAEESSQKVPAAVTTAAAAAAAATTTDKRQHLGKLDITAAKAAEKELVPIAMQGKTESPTKSARTIPFTTTSSVPASPAVVAAPSPIKHAAAPRTLRLVSTPKVETPPAVAAPPPPLPQIPTVDKLRSRQASIASLNQPGTPASELISDTASMTSGMISRASSPPPTSTIVGSAPVRKVTKAQAKKNRQERKRQEEEKEKVEAGSDVEVVQAPIIGRKKKAKKPNTTPKPVAAMASAMKEAAAKSQPASPKSATVEDEPLETPSVASVKVQSARNSVSVTPEPEIQPEEVKERNEPSAQSVLNDLQKTGDLLVSALEFFKPLSSTHASRTSSSGHATMPPDLKIHFSEADLDALAKKMPVHINGQDGKPDSRTLITPNGTFLWGLTAELEERALHLESEIEKLTGYLRFHPTSKSASNHNSSVDVLPALATAIREAAVPKKLPNSPTSNLKFDPQTLSQQLPPVHPKEFTNAHSMVPTQQQTPADAGAYLNQFVLPATDNPPPNHPRPEMAAVGGAPGSGTTHISIQPGPGRHAEGFEKVARAVLEGGAVGSTEIDGLASMTGDKSGGVWVRGLEGLIGAGLGMGENPRDRAEIRKVLEGLDQAGFALPPSSRELPLSAGSAGGRFIDRRCVLGLEEAEHAMALARREHEVLERKLGALIKRNRKLATGNAR